MATTKSGLNLSSSQFKKSWMLQTWWMLFEIFLTKSHVGTLHFHVNLNWETVISL